MTIMMQIPIATLILKVIQDVAGATEVDGLGLEELASVDD